MTEQAKEPQDQSSDDTVKQKRDMGTVGGGNIPGGGSRVEESGGASDENRGEGSSTEGESVKNSSEGSEPTATNTVDKQAQSSSGGRHPSQPQTAMGDQDATQGRSGDEVTEPMSSRAPDKINKK